jgi:hypothetical protein
MPAFNRETVLCGATLIASGSSQQVYSWVFSESIWFAFGGVCLSLGVVVTLLSLLRIFRSSERPLGITVLGLGYGAFGLAILAGTLLFTPILLLTIVFLAVSYGLIKGKAQARQAALLTTVLGLSTSIVMGTLNTSIPLVDSFPLVPSVLGSVYLLWYLNRSHVARFFSAEKATQDRVRHTETEGHPKGPMALTVGLLLLAVFLAYCYFNPPNDYVILQDVINIDVQGAGELGNPARGSSIRFSASRGDFLNYSFRCMTAQPNASTHFWVTREVNETAQVTVLEEIGFEGSGSALIPQTGKYTMWIAVQRAGKVTVRCIMLITSLSLRRPFIQLLFLSLFGAAASIFLTLAPTVFN